MMVGMQHPVISHLALPADPIHPDFDDFVGHSAVMRALYTLIDKAARHACNILISGESGTGKDLTARSLHRRSPRAGAPFIRLNCAALAPELVDSELFGHCRGAFTGALRDYDGVLARAHGGTLFLDEITELPLYLQAKLLHAAETGHYRRLGDGRERHSDVRIIAATNRDLALARQQGLLREDLYHRLSGLHINLPALRERGHDDMIRLSRYLLAQMGVSDIKLDNSAEHWLAHQQWPGNIRELTNTLRRATLMHDPQHALCAGDFSHEATTPNGQASTLAAIERNIIERTLQQHNGNIRSAAKTLGVSPSTLHRKNARWQKRNI